VYCLSSNPCGPVICKRVSIIELRVQSNQPTVPGLLSPAAETSWYCVPVCPCATLVQDAHDDIDRPIYDKTCKLLTRLRLQPCCCTVGPVYLTGCTVRCFRYTTYLHCGCQAFLPLHAVVWIESKLRESCRGLCPELSWPCVWLRTEASL